MIKSYKWKMRLVLFILSAIMSASAVVPASFAAEGSTPLKTGNYFYSPTPDAGSSPDRVTSGLVSSANGILFDGLSTYAGWMGSATAPLTVRVVFDLLKDYPLDQIRIIMNSQNIYWGFKDVTVKYRPESKLGYYIAARHVRTGTDLNYTISVPMANATARYVILEIRRTQAYQHIPLTEVEFYKGSGDAGTNSAAALTASEIKGELSKDALMVDKYGQWMSETWPGKVGYDVQLQLEYANEAALLAASSLNLSKYDAYGGIKSLGKYTATGFFRLQKIDGKWWFITPEGYPFIMKGVDAASLWEAGYKTPINKADGTPKAIFDELPDKTAFSPAYTNDANGQYVSFVVANVMKKYGADYEAKWEDITKKRLIDWGFNAFAKWTKPKNVMFPYVQVLQDPSNLRRISWTYDVFDPASEGIIDTALKTQLQSAKSSPWLIGYTYDNEAGWDSEIVKQILLYNASSPAKSTFVDFMAARYNNDLTAVNHLLGTSASSFAALKDAAIDVARVPAIDVSEYIRLASKTYYSMIRNIIKKYDTNHLFLGSSVVPTWRTSLDWDQAGMAYVDAFSVDSYTQNADWIARYAAFDKPLINQEYSFGTSIRGLTYISAPTKTGSIAERGTAFKKFLESQAANSLFVGSGWYSYYDQPVTGRPDGESYNTGLVNQQDQPYTEMTSIMKDVHAGLETLHSTAAPVTPAPVPVLIEAEKYTQQMGAVTVTMTGGGQYVGSLKPGDWTAYAGVNMTGIKNMEFKVASDKSGTVRVRLGGPSGDVVGTLNIASTGGLQTWKTSQIAIAPTAGLQNLYLTFENAAGEEIGNIDYFKLYA
ncbi:carbohydrate-binding protein [Cohnella hashimotonis]|uniref:Carbohydrate-binding protein n=1 Tax=Cohnella hashimotonis TaxID=2826895 RepID=A0ABT6TH67_9BACL|nr:carbohydrate-binding protein [Cohnella hashimotonis]MDI4645931.1 carbohydrate-binding protein [Cohnella hashimotonis]